MINTVQTRVHSTEVMEELSDLASGMIEQVKSGRSIAAELDSILFQYVKNNKDAIRPDFLLDTCKYFKTTNQQGAQIIFNLVTNLKLSIKPVSDVPSGSIVEEVSKLPESERKSLEQALNT